MFWGVEKLVHGLHGFSRIGINITYIVLMYEI